MATNVVPLIPYQINQRAPIPLAQTTVIAFPSQGVLLRDTSNSSTRSLSTGVNVYSAVQTADGTLYYVSNTASSLVTLFNA
jgi:hypothetical protein